MKFRLIGSFIIVAIFGIAFMQLDSESPKTSVESVPAQSQQSGSDAFSNLKIN